MDERSVAMRSLPRTTGALLAATPLPRLQKVQSLLLDLAGLAGGGGSGGALAGWLQHATSQWPLAPSERDCIVATWPTAIVQAWSAWDSGARARAQACKRLKLLLRDFAERRSRELQYSSV
jgi:hypothetical protein